MDGPVDGLPGKRKNAWHQGAPQSSYSGQITRSSTGRHAFAQQGMGTQQWNSHGMESNKGVYAMDHFNGNTVLTSVFGTGIETGGYAGQGQASDLVQAHGRGAKEQAHPSHLRANSYEPASQILMPADEFHSNQDMRQKQSKDPWAGLPASGGAQWMPPSEQLPVYEAILAFATKNGGTNSTVSGRKAVEFFQRSDLPKDALKAIWTLCDPSHLGFLPRLNFFAAMRLIAMTQVVGEPPSLSAFQQAYNNLLPPPRMRGVTPWSESSNQQQGGAVLASLTSSPPSNLPVTSIDPSLAFSSLRGVPSAEAKINYVPNGAENPGKDFAGEEGGRTGEMRVFPGGSVGMSCSDVEEEDFGDFIAAGEATIQPPGAQSDEEEEFGDFSGAGVGETKGEGERREELQWMMGDAGDAAGVSSVEVIPQENLLEARLKESLDLGRKEPPHLACLQSAPSLLGAPHPPVMVDRSMEGDVKNRLSVFDALADLDVAADQEDWHDFVDETTAPLPPAFPPPSPPRVHSEDVLPAAVKDEAALGVMISDQRGDRRVDQVDFARVGICDGGDDTAVDHGAFFEVAERAARCDLTLEHEGSPPSVVPGGGGGAAAAAAAAAASIVATRPSVVGLTAQPISTRTPPLPGIVTLEEIGDDNDEWGDFEDASESKVGEGQMGVQTGHTNVDASSLVTSLAESTQDSTDEWGEFTDGGVNGVSAIADDNATTDTTEAPMSRIFDVDGGDSAAQSELKLPQQLPERERSASSLMSVPLPLLKGEEDDGDPFAEISPPSHPPPPPPRDDFMAVRGVFDAESVTHGDNEGMCRDGGEGEGVLSSGDGYADKPVVLLSLRELRDVLSSRGFLEEALEVQTEMELPLTTFSPAGPSVSPEGDSSGLNSRNDRLNGPGSLEVAGTIQKEEGQDVDQLGQSVDCGGQADSEKKVVRWRGMVTKAPAETLSEMADRVSSMDPLQGEKFRMRLVDGQLGVEEEASGAGGGPALRNALQRQRAGRRSIFLSFALRSQLSSSSSVEEGVESVRGTREQEFQIGTGLGLGLGLGMGMEMGNKQPPSLIDWETIVLYVTRLVEAGVAALDGRRAQVVDPLNLTHPSVVAPVETTTGGVPTPRDVGLEVSRSVGFTSFERGLREAVRVSRLLEASAIDALVDGGVKGMGELEEKWAEFEQRRDELRRSHPVPIDNAEVFCTASAARKTKSVACGSESGMEGMMTTIPTVEEIRKLCLEAPSGTELCGVCLQPLEVFGLNFPVLEYCGVRYLAGAANLWVNSVNVPLPSRITPHRSA